MSSRGLDGTSAVITGSSSGIGRATATALAAGGVASLLIHYRRNLTGAEETAAACQAHGCQASIIAADLSRPDDRARLVETAFDRLGLVHTWVNNAGADVLTGEIAGQDFEVKLKRLIEVDVEGTIHLSRMVAGRMLAQSWGSLSERPPSIVFVGWDQAPDGMEGDAGQMFAPVKAAVMAFAASLAQTVAPNIRVNTIAPGWIRTSWGQEASAYWQDRAKQQSLMQRWGSPEDVAKAVAYVADPDNTFVTGQTLNVNGGWNRIPPAE